MGAFGHPEVLMIKRERGTLVGVGAIGGRVRREEQHQYLIFTELSQCLAQAATDGAASCHYRLVFIF